METRRKNSSEMHDSQNISTNTINSNLRGHKEEDQSVTQKNKTYLSKSYKPATVIELPKGNYPDFVLVVGETIDDPEGGGCFYKSTLPPNELRRIEEANQVVEFLDNSFELKKLLEIYHSHQSADACDVTHIIENIRKAYSFTKILEALDRFDPEKNAAYPVQAKIANSMYMTYCFFRGFVDDAANVNYYASDLRKNTLNKMVELGYMKNNLSEKTNIKAGH